MMVTWLIYAMMPGRVRYCCARKYEDKYEETIGNEGNVYMILKENIEMNIK